MEHLKQKNKQLKSEKNMLLKTDLQKDTIQTEDYEQMMFVQWFRRTYSDVRIFSIPMGGHRHIAVATKMKATGAAKGVPDLFIPAWLCWIEMKREKGGSVSPEQRDWHAYLTGLGHHVIVGCGQEDAKEKMRNLGFVPRN